MSLRDVQGCPKDVRLSSPRDPVWYSLCTMSSPFTIVQYGFRGETSSTVRFHLSLLYSRVLHRVCGRGKIVERSDSGTIRIEHPYVTIIYFGFTT